MINLKYKDMEEIWKTLSQDEKKKFMMEHLHECVSAIESKGAYTEEEYFEAFKDELKGYTLQEVYDLFPYNEQDKFDVQHNFEE